MAERRIKQNKQTKGVLRNQKKSTVRESRTESYKVQHSQDQSYSSQGPVSQSTRKKTIIGLIVVILIALLYYFRGIFVVALVNGQPITHLALIQSLEQQGGNQTLKALVDKTLIYQEAAKKHISVSQSETNREMKNLQDNLASQGQNLNELLTSRGMSRDQLTDQIKTELLIKKLLADQINVSDKEVTDYIAANKDQLPQGKSAKDLRNYVKNVLEQQKLSQKAQSWISTLEKNAKISYFVNF